MQPIIYIDRKTGHREEEHVYGKKFIRLLYGTTLSSRLFGTPLAFLLARIPFFSSFYGYLQSRASSAKKVVPFIKAFGLDVSEFAKNPADYVSFNDFFTRKLKPEARPIDSDPQMAVIPADGRYWFYQNIEKADGFVVKGKKFDLLRLLKNDELAKKYAKGSMVIARLCPTDYHRFHFPCDCIPTDTQLINGWLYSVNPAAIKKNLEIFTENKRTLCILQNTGFGDILFLEIGATFVGSIHQTYTPGQFYPKGSEKGCFSFGASSLILLFPPNAIQFDQDLLAATAQGLEIRCLMGQSMGKKYKLNDAILTKGI